MAILKRWSDGYVLNIDSRREDPLYYYMREDDWSGAVGLEVQPLYYDGEASTVEIAVFRNHRQREQALGDTGREELYLRALPALAAHHDGWKQVLLRATNLELILESGSLTREMRNLGFSQEPHADPYSVVWSRE